MTPDRRMAGAGVMRRDGARGDASAPAVADPGDGGGMLLEDDSGLIDLEASDDEIIQEATP